MNSFNKRVYDMLLRVLVFAKTYPQFFEEGSVSVNKFESAP